ncbi:SGNH/GDSL hydrolase family protein [Streptomyces rectiverticillatus]|uniref:SGNH/GDSL hydrolase family protein n=1 Tax=Streptomyces rectiverticillatus TaxID=173860 RepID=UPI0015C3AEDF|nr:SGNH/GDSL hydrolase family protein [Streptomyces rectiverticillatus]QLE71933.1 SGNH/GDSL hydrolase family protein [Streptomyces rectiverticillatus]
MRRSTVRKVRGAARAAVAAVSAFSAALLVTGCDSGEGDTSAGKPSASPAAPAWNTRPGSIASLGDSITRGFDACAVFADCPEVSWATGTQVDSVARKLLVSPQTSSWNYARTGARMADLPGQMQSAIAHKPQLVTVLLGANDACRDNVADMTPAASFRADFEASVKKLRTSLPKSQLYVAGVPDLQRLWSQGRVNGYAKTVWKLGICPSMLKDSESADPAAEQRRAQVVKRVAEYNAILKDVCGRDALCRYDGAVHSYDFTSEALSKWDWFHPSRKGQGELAALAYRTITAEKHPA